jgi:transcriptional regulator with XRE-family HTH domain
MKTVGERIRQAREFRRMSGEELAHAAGYKHQSGISNIENRATSRGGMGIQKIAQALDVPIEWLINGPDTEDMSEVGRFSEAPKPLIRPVRVVKDRVDSDETDWPFHTVTKPQWATIPTETKEIIETFVRSMVQDAARNAGTN